jgi:hypothetical protein
MLKLLDRAIASVDERMILLAPPDREVPESFISCDFDLDRHSALIRQIQRFRGRVYLADGAVEHHQLSVDGRHHTTEDDKSWHLVLLDARDNISACAWYREHENTVYFNRLRLKHCPLISTTEWGDSLWRAIQGEIRRARSARIGYAEVGGWAVADEHRRSAEGLVLALAAYGLGEFLGSTLSVTTATARHGSCEILRRLGGKPLEVDGKVVPPYYDPSYRCTMQILRFDSREPNPRYAPLVRRLVDRFPDVAVVARPYWPMRTTTNDAVLPAAVAASTTSAGVRASAA